MSSWVELIISDQKMLIFIILSQNISPKLRKTWKSNSFEILAQNTIVGAWIWFLVSVLSFFVPLYRLVVVFSWYVVEFYSPFVDFQSCFDLVFLGFVKFCQFLLDLVEFGWLAFHFLVFWRFVFVLVAFGLASVNSRQGFPLFSVSAEFVADFIHVLSGVLSIFPNVRDCRRFC